MTHHISNQVTENLYCYIWQGWGNNCNTCVFKSVLNQNKHIIVDPGHVTNEAHENCLESLVEAMNSDGILLEDMGLIINTHSHPDHCGANETIVSTSGAGVALSREEDVFRTTIGERMYTMFGMKPPSYKPLHFLQDGDLDVGQNFRAKVILSPGHSPGSVCLYLPDAKVLITGDVVFFMSVGRTDFPGGDALLLQHSIERLSKLDTEILIPGHNTDPNEIIRGKDKIQRNYAAVQDFF